MKKYELTEKHHTYVKLRRIVAMRNIPEIGVKKGDLGGWIEREDNLSQEGSCWVSGKAQIFGEARVCGRAQVFGKARVYGKAQVYGYARVYDRAYVSDRARVYGEAQIYGEAYISGFAWVYDKARVSGKAQVSGYARVSGEAQIFGKAQVFGKARVCDGKWNISPLYLQGTKNSLTTGAHDKLIIGCHEYSVSHWLEHYAKIGQQEGYTDEQIHEYAIFIHMAANWLKRNFPNSN